MPILPIIGLVLALISAWVRFDPNAQAPAATGVAKYRSPSDAAIALWAVASLLGAFGGLSWLAGRWPGALGLWALALALVAPWGLVQAVFIPFGWGRLAAYGAFWSHGAWRLDPRGGALVAGWLAAMPRGGPDPALRAWLTAKFGGGVFADEPESKFRVDAGGVFHSVATEAEAPLLPGGAVAVGLAASAAGEADVARGVFQALAPFDPRLCPAVASKVAARWLAADALARGDWGALRAAPAREPTAQLAHLVARRIAGPHAEAPSELALWAALARTGRPALVELVRRAEAAPEPAAPTEAPTDALARALAAHVALLGDPRAERLRGAAGAWDAARVDNALATRIAARAAALGCSAASRDRVLAAAEEDLAGLVVAAALDVGVIEGPTLEAAARSVRERAVGDVEALAEGLARRVRAKRWACGADELREWVGVKLAYEAATRLGGEPVRRLMFGPVHREVCAQAVWLFNERGQKPLANAMFRWLLAEAEALSVEDLVRLQTKNVACGP